MDEHPELRITEPLHALIALLLGFVDLGNLAEIGDLVCAGLGLSVRNHNDRGTTTVANNWGLAIWNFMVIKCASFVKGSSSEDQIQLQLTHDCPAAG